MEVLTNNLQALAVNTGMLKQLAVFLLQKEHVDARSELSIAFVDEEKIRELNVKYRGIDEPTDVLAFPFGEVTRLDEKFGKGPPVILGDVAICPEVAKENAKKYSNSLGEELCLLLVHGILHLLGYDHENAEDEEKMKLREKETLECFFESYGWSNCVKVD